MKVNLGCGGNKLAGYVNVDAAPEANPDLVLNIGSDPFPWEDNSVDVVQCWHIFEHLYPKEFFHCLKEIYRVLKPTGALGVIVPHPRHDVFLNDPTHIHFITPDGMLLFSRKHHQKMKDAGYPATTYSTYLGVDFDLQEPVGKILDPRIDPEGDWETQEKVENNVVIEYRFTMKPVK